MGTKAVPVEPGAHPVANALLFQRLIGHVKSKVPTVPNIVREFGWFVVNGGASYVFVVYLRGIDPVFVANGGKFAGEIATEFTLEVERPE